MTTPASASFLLEDYELNRERFSENALDEAAWYTQWQALIANDLTPMQIALKGGLYASDPPWIFVSGYQAAVRNVFPELPKGGWVAFVASEDQQDPHANPPMCIIKTGNSSILQGTKSWVAQSRHVDYLVVTALTHAKHSTSKEAVAVIVNRHQEGITLSHRKNPGFLPALSQGFARIQSIDINNTDILPETRRKEFIKNESKFVMLSCSASMYAKTVEISNARASSSNPVAFDAVTDLKEQLRALVIDLASACEDSTLSIGELAILDKNFQTLFASYETFIQLAPPENWHNDRKIFFLYSDGIQKRTHRKQAME